MVFGIPIDDFVFVVCTLVGGGLLLIALLVDDLVDVRVGGVPLTPLLVAFISMVGVGGLFATHVLDAHGGQAMLAGAGAGVVGMGVTFLLHGLLRRAQD